LANRTEPLVQALASVSFWPPGVTPAFPAVNVMMPKLHPAVVGPATGG